MSKGIENPTFKELLNDLISISKTPKKVNILDEIRLIELVNQLDEMLFEKFKDINNTLIANHNHEHPRMRDIEHWKNNISQYGFTYNSLTNLKEFIQQRIIELQETVNIDNSNQSKNEKTAPQKWLPIGVGFATGEIQELLKKGVSNSRIAIQYTGNRSDAGYVSNYGSGSKPGYKNIYSDFNKLKIVYDHCIENKIQMCEDFINAYDKKLKEIS
jgi:hypothetical protein